MSLEVFIVKILGVFIFNLVIFGLVTLVNIIFKHRITVYFGFSALLISLVASIFYVGGFFQAVGFWPVWFFVLAVLTLLIWAVWEYFFIKIPADPPTIGVLTVWGERRIIWGQDSHGNPKRVGAEYVQEGLRFHAPYFPFFLSYIQLEMTKRNKEMEITVWCKRETDPNDPDAVQMGAQMKVYASYTWAPDPDRLYMFLQTGEDKGVEQILPDVIEEEAREVAQENFWEEFLALQQTVTNRIIKKVTDEESARSIVNGSSDVQEMGTLLYRLNVKSIDPVDEDLRNSVTAFSREKRERQAEVYEMETEAEQATILMEKARAAGKQLNFDEAYALVKRYKLTREGKLNARHFSFEGIEALAPILQNLLGGRNE